MRTPCLVLFDIEPPKEKCSECGKDLDVCECEYPELKKKGDE